MAKKTKKKHDDKNVAASVGGNGHSADVDESIGLSEVDLAGLDLSEIDPQRLPIRLPLRWLLASGLYTWSRRISIPERIPRIPVIPRIPRIPQPIPGGDPIPRLPRPQPDPLPVDRAFNEDMPDGYGGEDATDDLANALSLVQSEELRLDVDGRYPQMTASGAIRFYLRARMHWIASIRKRAANQYSGKIWFKEGDTARFPYAYVDITVQRSFLASQHKAIIEFYTFGRRSVYRRTYRYRSPSFHRVEFEYDTVAGAGSAVTSIRTHDHANRPAGLPNETLSLDTVYRRAGFDVRGSGGNSIVPLSGAGSDARWSNQEMHDAMQLYWSRFANRPQWSMWTFFASLSERGSSLGGIMFDSIGPNHRQGTAVFLNSFIKDAPSGDADAAAWVRRMRFWTAAHEMGHAFNLAHSWQKTHPPAWGTSWRTPLPNEPEARSFMNYPYNVAGGQSAFFQDFEFRFSDSELLFMRHAPERFAQQGNADWFDNHGFEQANVRARPIYTLDVRANREKKALNGGEVRFAFMEPVILELKLKNVSGQAQMIEDHVLAEADHMTIIVKKEGRPAQQHAPYMHAFHLGEKTVLGEGEAMYEPLYLASDAEGWKLDEPGRYTVQVALHLDDEDIVSAPLRLCIKPPMQREEEHLAQDYFTEEVGRVLGFNGSRHLDAANDVLREVTEAMPDTPAAVHAHVALGTPLMHQYKLLDLNGDESDEEMAASVHEAGGKAKTLPAQEDNAREQLQAALIAAPQKAAQTLGHVAYKRQADAMSAMLAEGGENKEAAEVQGTLHETLQKRGVLDSVLKSVERQKKKYAKKSNR